jgi:hypothetical protein
MDILEADTSYFQRLIGYIWGCILSPLRLYQSMQRWTTTSRVQKNLSTVCNRRVTVNWTQHLAMPETFKSDAEDVKCELWLQQVGATMHIARKPTECLRPIAVRPVISGFGWHRPASHFSWPLDVQLLSWELLKAKVQAKTARKLGWLQEHIRDEVRIAESVVNSYG